MKRMSKWRREVLKIIRENEIPLSAEEIYRLTSSKPDFSTIYRALSYLEEAELVKSVSFGNTPKYYYLSDKHYHFLYCINCGKIEVFYLCMAKDLEAKIKDDFLFQVFDHVFYFKGLCKQCRKRR